MRRKHKTYLFVLLAAPLAFGIPPLVNSHFPQQLLWFTKSFYLFPALAIIYCLMAFFKSKKKLSTINLLHPLKILSIMLLLLCGLFGQAGIFIQHAAAQGQINNLEKSKYILDLIHQFSWHTALWPWALLGIVTLSFIVCSKQHRYQPFSQWLPKFPFPNLYRMLRKGIDGYIETCTRIFVCLVIGIFLASLCLVIAHMNVRPIVGVLSFVFLLLMVYSRRFKNLEKNITAYNISPTAIFSCILVFMFFIAMLVKLMIVVLLNHADPTHSTTLLTHKTPLILHKQTWLMSWHLWFWSYWIIATPLIASVITKLTQATKIGLTVFYLLLFGALIAMALSLSPVHIHIYIAKQLLNTTTCLILQAISLIGILILFSSLKGHHIIWLGFVPTQTPKKLRVMRLRIVWALIAMGFGSMLLSGLQSILLIQMLVAIVGAIILLVVALYTTRVN